MSPQCPIRIFFMWLFVPALALLATVQAGEPEVEFEEGFHYHMIFPAVPVQATEAGDVEVLELFWYGCPHCYTFEKYLDSWKQNKAGHVKFIRMPVALNRGWTPHARAYYALEKMDEAERIHPLFFEAIHVQGRRVRDMESISRFLSQHGVDTEEFEKAYNSSYVEERIQHSKQFVRNTGTSSVPTVIINGKYRSTASVAGGHDRLLQLIDYLVQQETN